MGSVDSERRFREAEAEWVERFQVLEAENNRLTVDLVGRIERLENIAVLLCQEASRGQGQMGKPFWEFIDAIGHERDVDLPALGSCQT